MIKWISFQSLAGGMMLGAEEAFNCPPLFTIDYDGIDTANSSAYVHYMNNVRKEPVRQLVLGDNLLSRTQQFKNTEDEIYFTENCKDIDVACAVPLCSGLSQANSAKTGDSARGVNAIQNNNMKGITEFTLERIKPRVYIFENAPILFSNSSKPLREWFENIAKENGYSVTWIKTNTKLHSNVQTRTRTFGIMWKGDSCPKLYGVNHPVGTIVDYLSTIDKNAKYNTSEYNLIPDINESGYIIYMKLKYGDNFQKYWPYDKGAKCVTEVIELNNDFDLAKSVMNEKEASYIDHVIEKRSQGKNYFDGTPIYWGDSEISSLFGRTIERMIHPTECRGYTVREALKFMGMPDDYDFPDIMKHLGYIGQNVPVITARDWCLEIRDYLEGKLPMLNKSVDMFDNTKQLGKFEFGV